MSELEKYYDSGSRLLFFVAFTFVVIVFVFNATQCNKGLLLLSTENHRVFLKLKAIVANAQFSRFGRFFKANTRKALIHFRFQGARNKFKLLKKS